MTEEKPPRHTHDRLELGDLTGGAYLGAPEVAARLGISDAQLRVLLNEKMADGKKRAVSRRAQALPKPLGRVQTVAWRSEDIEAIAGGFNALAAKTRGRHAPKEAEGATE